MPSDPKHLNSEIEIRFTYHPVKEGQAEKYEVIRDQAKILAYTLEELCPPCRETSLALTYLEKVVMFANAGIARRS